MISILANTALSFPTGNSIESRLYLPPIVYGTIHEMIGMLSRLVNAVELVPFSKTSYSYDPEPSQNPGSTEEEERLTLPSLLTRRATIRSSQLPLPGSDETGQLVLRLARTEDTATSYNYFYSYDPEPSPSPESEEEEDGHNFPSLLDMISL